MSTEISNDVLLDKVGEMFVQIVAGMQEISSKVDVLTGRVDVLTTRVDVLTSRVDGLTEAQVETNRRLNYLEGAVKEMLDSPTGLRIVE